MIDYPHHFAQAYVLATSAAAIYCVARTDKWHRWGFVFGFASEPGWLYIAWPAQWGVLVLTGWWSWWWFRGARVRFGKFA